MPRCMGIFDRFEREDDDREKWIVVARDQKKQAVSMPDEIEKEDRTFYGEPVNKETWRHDYGKHLEEGVRYICVKVQENGYNFENPAWEIDNTGGPGEVQEAERSLKRKIEGLEERFEQQSVLDHPLLDVSDTDELEAKAAGVGMAKAATEGDMDTFERMFGMLVQANRTGTGNPTRDLISNIDSDFSISSPTDLAMVMALPELQGVMQQGKTALGNFNQLMGNDGSSGRSAAQSLTGGDSGGGGGDTVQVSRQELEDLRTAARQGQQEQPPDQPTASEPDDGGGGDGEFSMSDILEETDGDETDGETNDDETESPDQSEDDTDDETDDEPEFDGQEFTTGGSTVDAAPDARPEAAPPQE